jgi:hypothetical protein
LQSTLCLNINPNFFNFFYFFRYLSVVEISRLMGPKLIVRRLRFSPKSNWALVASHVSWLFELVFFKYCRETIVILLNPRLLFRSATHTCCQEEHSLCEATETIVILLNAWLLFRSATHTWRQEEHSLCEATETIVILLNAWLLFRSATHTWRQEEHSLFEATETIVLLLHPRLHFRSATHTWRRAKHSIALVALSHTYSHPSVNPGLKLSLRTSVALGICNVQTTHCSYFPDPLFEIHKWSESCASNVALTELVQSEECAKGMMLTYFA